MIAVATDKASPEELKKPAKYDIKDIALMATIFGTVSSIFDFLIFIIFIHFGEHILQTGWFIESIITEILLIFSLRTKGFFLKAPWPGDLLVFTGLSACLVTIAVTLDPLLQRLFHFRSLSLLQSFIVAIIILLYVFANEAVKYLYHKNFNGKRSKARA